MKPTNKPSLDVAALEVRIAEYLISNPNPKDLSFHSFAAGLNVDKEVLEEIAYRMLSTMLVTAMQWNLLQRDPREMNTLMYMAGCDVDVWVPKIMQSTDGDLSPNMIDLCLRMRKADDIARLTQERQRELSYGEDLDLSEAIHKKASDQTVVNDPNRITFVNDNLKLLGLAQTQIDTAMRLLDLDRYPNESALLNTAYNSLREALIAHPDNAFDDPDFQRLKDTFNGLAEDRRDQGQQIRIAKVRQAARIMREITTRYGISNRGLFSSMSTRN